MKYSDLDPNKTAFIFELDNVLYPKKDYLYQVYYLFAAFLEYTEQINSKSVTNCMIDTYLVKGVDAVFDQLKTEFDLDEKYRDNFAHLNVHAKLPLKLVPDPDMINLLQEIVIDRKKIFIVTNGAPAKQLNKIKQTVWNGLEPYLVCYFADEIAPKPETDSIDLLIKDHRLQRRNVLMFGNSDIDARCAEACGIDYINIKTK
jgi:FMN phosphatase YigB (HAD superfamily)